MVFERFNTKVIEVLKESILKPLRRDAGLCDPPCQFTTNDVEATNFMIKHSRHSDLKRQASL